MHCRTARELLIGRELGLLPDESATALERHLESCAACAAEARVEALMTADLAALRGESTSPVDGASVCLVTSGACVASSALLLGGK